MALKLEFSTIFILLPILAAFRLLPLSPGIILLGVSAYCLIKSLNKMQWRELLHIKSRHLKSALLRSLLIVPTIIFVAWIVNGDELLVTIRSKQNFLLMTALIYPLISVLPQEIIYRIFFYRRYEKIFSPHSLIILNALLFSFLHLAYGNSFAMITTLLAGLYFATIYFKSRSLPILLLEHSAYGLLIFALGLGERYFYLESFL